MCPRCDLVRVELRLVEAGPVLHHGLTGLDEGVVVRGGDRGARRGIVGVGDDGVELEAVLAGQRRLHDHGVGVRGAVGPSAEVLVGARVVSTSTL